MRPGNSKVKRRMIFMSEESESDIHEREREKKRGKFLRMKERESFDRAAREQVRHGRR